MRENNLKWDDHQLSKVDIPVQSSLSISFFRLVWATHTRKTLTGLNIEVTLSHTRKGNLEVSNPRLVWLLHKAVKIHISFAILGSGFCPHGPIWLIEHQPSHPHSGHHDGRRGKKEKNFPEAPHNNFTCIY